MENFLIKGTCYTKYSPLKKHACELSGRFRNNHTKKLVGSTNCSLTVDTHNTFRQIVLLYHESDGVGRNWPWCLSHQRNEIATTPQIHNQIYITNFSILIWYFFQFIHSHSEIKKQRHACVYTRTVSYNLETRIKIFNFNKSECKKNCHCCYLHQAWVAMN